MADEGINNMTQPDSVGNLLGDSHLGNLDNYSSSAFQSEPLQPQPSAPHQMMSSGSISSSNPLDDDFGFDSHITSSNTVNPSSNTTSSGSNNSAQSSSSYTPGPWLKKIDPKEQEPEVSVKDLHGYRLILEEEELEKCLNDDLRRELYRGLRGELEHYLEEQIDGEDYDEDLFEDAVYYDFLDLIYWRDVKKTAVVFGSMLFILLSLAIYSVLTVIAYLSLAILAVTLSFRVYKNIMQAVQKSGDGHPFKEYLECDIELNDQKTQKVVKLILKHTNATVQELRRLFLIEDLVDSLKFGLLLWVLTYIGSWFNGMTIIINSVVIIFTLPKIYETYKVQIDNYLAMARSQFNKILQQVQSKLPFLKKKAKAQ
ncbi:reticulon-1-A isoform X2 [Octopus bimaculoides]|uniref:reticulon-1-A isoform X2 n=1 Tax=Octopus bimaculoides TaxID=37653 RepID=UPI0022E0317E|nr:reticulon-1-A isoform X2 [Octopus bimaculoides]